MRKEANKRFSSEKRERKRLYVDAISFLLAFCQHNARVDQRNVNQNFVWATKTRAGEKEKDAESRKIAFRCERSESEEGGRRRGEAGRFRNEAAANEKIVTVGHVHWRHCQFPLSPCPLSLSLARSPFGFLRKSLTRIRNAQMSMWQRSLNGAASAFQMKQQIKKE